MGFFGSVFSGIAKVLLWPFEQLVGSALYKIFIIGPLSALNYIDNAFNYVSGSNIEGILFGTSVKDGQLDINFFASTSPLKNIFLICLAIGGVLLTLLIGLKIAATLMKNRQSPIKKVIQAIGVGTGVFSLPIIFITILSLSSTFLSLLTGANLVVGEKNISTFQNKTIAQLNKVENHIGSNERIWDISRNYHNTTDYNGITKAMNIEDIYKEFEKSDKEEEYKFLSSDIKTLVKQNKDIYYELKNLVTKYENNIIKNHQNLSKHFNYIKLIISDLKQEEKDQNKSEKIKEAINYLSNIVLLINQYNRSANDIIKYLPNKLIKIEYESDGKTTANEDQISKQGWLINNFKIMKEDVFGKERITSTVKNINNLEEFATEINFLINGQINILNSGLLSLKIILSPYNESSLATIFYQVATGNKDSNWENSSYSSNSGNGMALLGFFLIIGAIIIMTMALIFALIRIFDLALLFCISPIPIFYAPIDEGARAKTWAKITIGKMLSIFGIVITLRVFGSIAGVFSDSLNSVALFGGDSGRILKLVLTGLFYLSGMIAAYHSTTLISSLVGAGNGIFDNSAISSARIISKGTRFAGKNIMKSPSFALKNTKNLVGGNPFSISGRENMKRTWSGRFGNLNKVQKIKKWESINKSREERSNLNKDDLDKKINKQKEKYYKKTKGDK